MPKRWFKLLLFLSSYSPLTIIFFCLYFGQNPYLASAVLGVGIVGLASLYVFIARARKLSPLDYPISQVQSKDGEAMSYIVTYIIPFVSLVSPDANQVIALGVFFFVLAILYVNSDMIHINPMLNLAGFHIYEVNVKDGDRYALISKIRPKSNSSIKAIVITNEILLGVQPQ